MKCEYCQTEANITRRVNVVLQVDSNLNQQIYGANPVNHQRELTICSKCEEIQAKKGFLPVKKEYKGAKTH